jgi:hypothetical protein
MSLQPLHSAFRRLVTWFLLPLLAAMAAPTLAESPTASKPAPVVKAAGGVVGVVEFYNATLNHYFISADPAEIAALDGGALGGAWKRTGNMFSGWDVEGPPAGTVPVCRFFGTDQYRSDSSRIGPNSHFYTADPNECEYVKTAWQSVASDGKSYPAWTFESLAFAVQLPAAGACSASAQTLYRTYNNGANGDPNHRYSTNAATLQAMTGWVFEGLVMCLPPSLATYVSASRGDDTNSGTQVAPFKTIQRGIDATAAGGGGIVHISGGAYTPVTLLSNVSLVGAHNPDTWLVDTANFTTRIEGGPVAVRGAKISNVLLRNLLIVASPGANPGESSIAVGLQEATGVVIADSRIVAGNGSAGQDGNAGTPGTSGANGGNGANAGDGDGGTGGGGGSLNALRRGGNGGDGAFGLIAAGQAGTVGNAGNGGASGGSRGAGGSITSGPGLPGGMGGVGASGTAGASAALLGQYAPGTCTAPCFGLYLPAAATSGTIGRSGGGGGGGGGGAVGAGILPLRGAGGGGGGQGGNGGGGGVAGTGGGGSIGVAAFNGSEVTLQNNTLQTGNGGAGGRGGSGAARGGGGAGGSGGTTATFVQWPGGNGGGGGAGGLGGVGGSGAGGPVAGVMLDPSSNLSGSVNTIILGNPGSRSGTPTGIAAEVLELP